MIRQAIRRRRRSAVRPIAVIRSRSLSRRFRRESRRKSTKIFPFSVRWDLKGLRAGRKHFRDPEAPSLAARSSAARVASEERRTAPRTNQTVADRPLRRRQAVEQSGEAAIEPCEAFIDGEPGFAGQPGEGSSEAP